MPIAFYDYAQCIPHEIHVDNNWLENEVVHTLYRIHGYSHDMLIEAQDSGLFYHLNINTRQRLPFHPLLGGFPKSFKADTYIKKFPYFSTAPAVLDDYSYNWFVTIALDIYHFTWHLLHKKITIGQFNMYSCMKLKDLCEQLEHGLATVYSLNAEINPPSRQTVTVKDDYITMIVSVLNRADEGTLPFKEAIPKLDEMYPERSMFIGLRIKAYFFEGKCFVQKGKASNFRPINSNTLQNYYSMARQICKRAASKISQNSLL